MATRPSDRTAATRAKYLIPGTGVARVCRRFRQIRKWNIPQLRWFVKNYFPDRNKDARRNTKRDREPGQQQRNEETKYYKPRMNKDGRMGKKKRGTRILIGPQSRGDDGGRPETMSTAKPNVCLAMQNTRNQILENMRADRMFRRCGSCLLSCLPRNGGSGLAGGQDV